MARFTEGKVDGKEVYYNLDHVVSMEFIGRNRGTACTMGDGTIAVIAGEPHDAVVSSQYTITPAQPGWKLWKCYSGEFYCDDIVAWRHGYGWPDPITPFGVAESGSMAVSHGDAFYVNMGYASAVDKMVAMDFLLDEDAANMPRRKKDLKVAE